MAWMYRPVRLKVPTRGRPIRRSRVLLVVWCGDLIPWHWKTRPYRRNDQSRLSMGVAPRVRMGKQIAGNFGSRIAHLRAAFLQRYGQGNALKRTIFELIAQDHSGMRMGKQIAGNFGSRIPHLRAGFLAEVWAGQRPKTHHLRAHSPGDPAHGAGYPRPQPTPPALPRRSPRVSHP